MEIDVWDSSIELWIRTAAWIESLDVMHGSLAGTPMRLYPWQIDYIKAICDPNFELLALSVARGNGKTTLLGAIVACALAGPLAVPNSVIPVVASDKAQAGITIEHAFLFLEKYRLADPARWSYRESRDEWMIRNKYDNIITEAVSADPRSKHGASPPLSVADEPAQWQPNSADRVFNALVGSRGKQSHSRVAMIGTMPDTEHHFFTRTIRDGESPEGRRSGVWGKAYAAPPKSRFDDVKAVKKANPMWDYIPSLRKTIVKEIEAVKRGSLSKASFKAYRMNMGNMETQDTEYLLGENTLEVWQSCVLTDAVFDSKHPREGDVYLGLDIGETKSMTAAVMYWPATGRLEVLAAIPTGSQSLEEREREDGYPGAYAKAKELGELITFPAKTTPVDQFLKVVADRLGGQKPVKVYADRYRQAAVEQAVMELKTGWDKRLEFRGAGAGPHGHADIVNFGKEIFEGTLKSRTSVLMMTALRDARVKRDTNANASLNKSRQRARIDVLSAGLMAVSGGYQSRLPQTGEKRKRGIDSYIVRY